MVDRLDCPRRVIRNDGLPLQDGWLPQLGVPHLAMSLSQAEKAKQVMTDMKSVLSVCSASSSLGM